LGGAFFSLTIGDERLSRDELANSTHVKELHLRYDDPQELNAATCPDLPSEWLGKAGINELRLSAAFKCALQLPMSLDSLPALCRLRITKCDTEVHPLMLPAELPAQLEQLELMSLHVTALPESYGSLPQLALLELHGTSISALPACVMEMSGLRRLLFRKSTPRLVSLPDDIGKLDGLCDLDLDEQALETLPVSIIKLVNLRRISARNNKLLSFPVLPAWRLAKADFYGNPIREVPPERAFLWRAPGGAKDLVLRDLRVDLRHTQLDFHQVQALANAAPSNAVFELAGVRALPSLLQRSVSASLLSASVPPGVEQALRERVHALERQLAVVRGRAELLRSLPLLDLEGLVQEITCSLAAVQTHLAERRLEAADSKASEEEQRRRNETCSVCMDAPRTTALVPCGHVVCCDDCAVALVAMDVPTCPSCRAPIASTLRVYVS